MAKNNTNNTLMDVEKTNLNVKKEKDAKELINKTNVQPEHIRLISDLNYSIVNLFAFVILFTSNFVFSIMKYNRMEEIEIFKGYNVRLDAIVGGLLCSAWFILIIMESVKVYVIKNQEMLLKRKQNNINNKEVDITPGGFEYFSLFDI